MIRPLRQRHRRIVIALAVVLPVAFAAGIAARRPVPAMGQLPMALVPVAGNWENAGTEHPGLFAKTRIQVQLLRVPGETRPSAVQILAPKDFLKPDLLVYWLAGSVRAADKLPDQAVLLGAFQPSVALPLPPNAAATGGSLVLYSLADQEVVDASAPLPLSQ
jgi:hypothetical protein